MSTLLIISSYSMLRTYTPLCGNIYYQVVIEKQSNSVLKGKWHCKGTVSCFTSSEDVDRTFYSRKTPR